jgi:hypothetical protein
VPQAARALPGALAVAAPRRRGGSLSGGEAGIRPSWRSRAIAPQGSTG